MLFMLKIFSSKILLFCKIILIIVSPNQKLWISLIFLISSFNWSRDLILLKILYISLLIVFTFNLKILFFFNNLGKGKNWNRLWFTNTEIRSQRCWNSLFTMSQIYSIYPSTGLQLLLQLWLVHTAIWLWTRHQQKQKSHLCYEKPVSTPLQ